MTLSRLRQKLLVIQTLKVKVTFESKVIHFAARKIRFLSIIIRLDKDFIHCFPLKKTPSSYLGLVIDLISNHVNYFRINSDNKLLIAIP